MAEQVSTENQLLTSLKSGDQRVLTSVYKKALPMIVAYVRKNSGTEDDGKDLCQDALFIFIQKIKTDDFILTSELSTYIMAIAKNLWLKKLSKPKLNEADFKTESSFNETDEFDEDSTQLECTKKLSTALSQLGEPCNSLLKNFYYLKKTMQEIAELFHYTNPENAKNQKYKCLQRLKKLME